MKNPPVSCLTVLVLTLLMSGCETSDTNSRLQRIQEKSMAYAVLPPRQQQDIKEGAIEVGYTDAIPARARSASR
jgi:hypothetical protein